LQVSNATGQEAPEDDQEVPGDTVMNDTESESDIEEISAGAALSVPVQEVCRFFSKSCDFDLSQFCYLYQTA
jgi:hypothetical protein